MLADSSEIIGTSCSNNGTFAFFPINFLYLVSFGLTKTATHAPSNSGLVVAIGKSATSLLVLEVVEPENFLFSGSLPTVNFNVVKKVFLVLSSNSACAIGVPHSGQKIVGKLSLYIKPFL